MIEPKTPFLSLPSHVLSSHIFSTITTHLDYQSAAHLGATCKTLNKEWKSYMAQTFPSRMVCLFVGLEIRARVAVMKSDSSHVEAWNQIRLRNEPTFFDVNWPGLDVLSALTDTVYAGMELFEPELVIYQKLGLIIPRELVYASRLIALGYGRPTNIPRLVCPSESYVPIWRTLPDTSEPEPMSMHQLVVKEALIKKTALTQFPWINPRSRYFLLYSKRIRNVKDRFLTNETASSESSFVDTIHPLLSVLVRAFANDIQWGFPSSIFNSNPLSQGDIPDAQRPYVDRAIMLYSIGWFVFGLAHTKQSPGYFPDCFPRRLVWKFVTANGPWFAHSGADAIVYSTDGDLPLLLHGQHVPLMISSQPYFTGACSPNTTDGSGWYVSGSEVSTLFARIVEAIRTHKHGYWIVADGLPKLYVTLSKAGLVISCKNNVILDTHSTDASYFHLDAGISQRTILATVPMFDTGPVYWRRAALQLTQDGFPGPLQWRLIRLLRRGSFKLVPVVKPSSICPAPLGVSQCPPRVQKHLPQFANMLSNSSKRRMLR